MRGMMEIMKRFLGTVGSLAGCAHLRSLPKWVDNPPKDHYVGVSSCSPNTVVLSCLDCSVIRPVEE